MNINLVYDSSVTNSPYAANIMRAAQEAANLLDTTFSNPITINISVGWGEEDGNTITKPAAIAQSDSNGDVFGYDDVRNALIGAAHTVIDQIAASTLPTSDPTGGTTIGGNVYISQAEQKALGLRDANDPGLDGSVGLNSSDTFFLDGQAGAIGNPAGTTQYDAVGALAHEMSEVMGRVAGLGQKTYATSVNSHQYTALDFFRSLGPDDRDLTPGPGTSFSIDNIHMLSPYDDSTTSAGNDGGDWAPGVIGDSFGYASPSTVGALSPVDIAEMNVLGYQPTQQIIDIPIVVSTGETVSGALVTSGGFIAVSSGGIFEDSVLSGDTAFTKLNFAGGYFSATIPAPTFIEVNSGGYEVAVVLDDEAKMTVYGGGTAGVNTIVQSGGVLWVAGTGEFVSGNSVELGGEATDPQVETGGLVSASLSGVLVRAEADSGGTVVVDSGGYANLTDVLSSGVFKVGEFGSSNSASVISGGQMFVSGGSASFTAISNGGEVFVLNGSADFATVSAGGTVIVDAFGHTENTSAFGTEYVLSGGATTSATIQAVGTLVVSGGGVSVDARMGGSEFLMGVDSGSYIGGGGGLLAADQAVLAGGSAQDETVAGAQEVSAGGTATGTVLLGYMRVYNGGTAVASQLMGGSIQLVYSIDTVSETNFEGGEQDVALGGVVSGAMVLDGTQDVFASGTADFAVLGAAGSQGVFSGGTVSNTVFDGGVQFVFSQAVVSNTNLSDGSQVIDAGGTASATRIGAAGSQTVDAGGTASGTIVGSGGVETVAGLDLDAILNDGGTQIVAAGGVASSTILNDPGTQIIAGGGTATGARVSGGVQDVAGLASNTRVGSGGVENVSAGGTASATTIGSAGAGSVSAGGVADNTIVLGGGVETIFTGGTANGTMVSSGGKEIVSSGGLASNQAVAPGGSLVALSGGAIAGGVVTGTGIETVSASGTAIGDTVSAGGTQFDFGRTTGTTVGNGGDQAVSSGGFASAAILLVGGTQHVWSGATISGTSFSGGTQDVLSGAIVVGAAVGSGLQNVSAGGGTSATSVGSAGSQEVYGSASATVLQNGGVQDVHEGGSVAGTVFDGGTQNVLAGAAVSSALVVAGFQNVMSGGTTMSTGIVGIDVVEYGLLTVFSGAVADDATVVGYLATAVLSGGTASNTSVGFGGPIFSHAGTLTVLAGGSAVGTDAYNDGFGVTTINVSSGGLADETTANNVQINVFSGGVASETTGYDNQITVQSGASISGTVQSYGGIVISAGAESDNTTLSYVGYEAVAGSAIDTTIVGGSVEIVSSGGVASDTTLRNDTSQIFVYSGQKVYAGGKAISTFVSASESQIVSSGGVAIDTTLFAGDAFNISTGGWQVLSSGASATATVVSNNARQYILGGTASDTTIYGGGDEIVTSNGTAISTTVASGGIQTVYAGGVASGTVVLNDGSIDLRDLTYAGTQPILSGNVLTVTEGTSVYQQTLVGDYTSGTFHASQDNGDGTLITLTGAVPSAPRTLDWTGAQDSNFANPADWNDISDGLDPAQAAPDAMDTVEFNTDSGAASGTNTVTAVDVGLNGTGVLELSGGVTLATGSLDAAVLATDIGQIGVAGAGTELLVTGSATVADDGTGVLSILSGATFAGSNLTIGNQGDSSGAMVVSGDGTRVTLSGALNIGTALGTGDLTVGPGATVNASVVNLQGDVVLEGGFLDPTVYIENSGSSTSGFGTVGADYLVLEGTIISNGTKLNKETEVVLGTVVGGGTLAISGGTTADGTTVNSPGILQIGTHDTIELTGAVLNAVSTTFTDTQTPTGTYAVTNSVIDVVFQDATGVLSLDDIAGFGGTIATYHSGDSFVITGGTLSNLGVSNGDTLTFSDAGSHAGAGGIDQIIFGSAISAAGFDIVGGNTVEAVACFAEGTRIETEQGPVAVEALTVGDRVVTVDGAREPIVWIGHRAVNCERHPAPQTVRPVRISTGAFGENVPARDLYLSPDHAVFVNGVLVPVKLLVNGASIIQVKRDRVRYFHVELTRHAVIVAEGLAVESYLNTGDRSNFHQVSETIRLFPNFAARLTGDAALAWETEGAAPLVVTGVRLEQARRAVMENAPNWPHGRAVFSVTLINERAPTPSR